MPNVISLLHGARARADRPIAIYRRQNFISHFTEEHDAISRHLRYSYMMQAISSIISSAGQRHASHRWPPACLRHSLSTHVSLFDVLIFKFPITNKLFLIFQRQHFSRRNGLPSRHHLHNAEPFHLFIYWQVFMPRRATTRAASRSPEAYTSAWSAAMPPPHFDTDYQEARRAKSTRPQSRSRYADVDGKRHDSPPSQARAPVKGDDDTILYMMMS